jgi:hypothetical protein
MESKKQGYAKPGYNRSPLTEQQKKEEFNKIAKEYLENLLKNTGKKSNSELEIRIGTNTSRRQPVSKIDYDNVVKQLYACGFTVDNVEGIQMLRIYTQYTDPNTGMVKTSNIRAEIAGTDLIQEYCRTNSIQHIIDMPSTEFNKLKFTQKINATDATGASIKRLDMDDFNFNVAYQIENDYNVRSGMTRNIIAKWGDSKKVFRSMNRVRFTHKTLPIFADLSIIKTSKKIGKVPIPTYTIQEAGVYDNMEHYEIELEVDNRSVGIGTRYSNAVSLVDVLRKSIRIVLSGLQQSKFPISFTERDDVLQSYMKLVHGEEYAKQPPSRVYPKHFIGPGSYTLQMENIVDNGDEQLNICNVRTNYTVTEKADGERALLYISEKGLLYLIDSNMNIMFTGAKTYEKTIFNSLMDGELVKHDKTGKYINLYMAFDVYYINKKSVREYIFEDSDAEDPDSKQRLPLLRELIGYINPISVMQEKGEVESKLLLQVPSRMGSPDYGETSPDYGETSPAYRPTTPTYAPSSPAYRPTTPTYAPGLGRKLGGVTPDMPPPPMNFGPNRQKASLVKQPVYANTFTIRCKEFYKDQSIFNACSRILSNVKDGMYEYETDGLIFTPSNLSVGGTTPGGPPCPLYKTSWEHSLKWKPEISNTIDFLVSVKKDKTGKDDVQHIFEEGTNLEGMQSLIQYKTLILMCGFNNRKHGFINPCQDIIDDVIPTFDPSEDTKTYRPMPFQPSDPSDPNACYCNIMLKELGNSIFMTTEHGEYFEEDMIVEFRYDNTKEDKWKWIPIRVRYDKTSELRAGGTNYGNAYHVANTNWRSIHKPVTDVIISTGVGIPDIISDDVYYVKSSNETSTRALRDFHNLFVKKHLILSISKRGDTLIDFAVGKAGDLSKWVGANLGFVFGIDISRDNIHNLLDGACSRILNSNRKYANTPRALFVVGNSGLNIRTGQAISTEKDKQIANAVFGIGPKDKTQLGLGVYKQYGVAEQGFNISSCQFAMHYFFENKTSFHQFLRNVAECTKINGYYIGTCYDGLTVFNALRTFSNGESMQIFKNDNKIYEITKRYDQTGFPAEEMSLGYAIDVYQESIGKVFREYLVNFEYFIRIMEDYGFVLVTKQEARNIDMPNGTGLFSELFSYMETEISRRPSKEADYGTALQLSAEERRISFMNRYFMFRKVRNIDVKKMFDVITKQHELIDRIGEKGIAELAKQTESLDVDVAAAVAAAAPKKIKRKLVLKPFAPVVDTIVADAKIDDTNAIGARESKGNKFSPSEFSDDEPSPPIAEFSDDEPSPHIADFKVTGKSIKIKSRK